MSERHAWAMSTNKTAYVYCKYDCLYIPTCIYVPEMASERMRSLIRKFELRSTAISSRCLAAARAILGKILRTFCFPSPPWSALVRPECPGEPRNAPRLQPEPFWEESYGFVFFPSPLGPPSFAKEALSASRFELQLKTTSKQYSVFSFSSVIFLEPDSCVPAF